MKKWIQNPSLKMKIIPFAFASWFLKNSFPNRKQITPSFLLSSLLYLLFFLLSLFSLKENWNSNQENQITQCMFWYCEIFLYNEMICNEKIAKWKIQHIILRYDSIYICMDHESYNHMSNVWIVTVIIIPSPYYTFLSSFLSLSFLLFSLSLSLWCPFDHLISISFHEWVNEEQTSEGLKWEEEKEIE